MKLLVALIFTTMVASCYAGMYGPNSPIITTIRKENFVKEVMNSNDLWVIELYANWCGHCKNFASHYEKVAENLDGLVKVAAIDVDEQKELAGLFKVQGIPAIRVIKPRSQLSNQNEFTPAYLEYNGPRTASDLIKFALNQLPLEVKAVSSSTYEEFAAANPSHSKVLLFTNKPKTSDLYKSLASRYFNLIDFGQVQDTDKELVERFKVESFPTLLLFPVDNAAKPFKYDGALKAASIDEFLAQHVPKRTDDVPKKPVDEPKPEVIEVTSDKILREKCVNKNGLCFITFLDPHDEEHSQNLEKLQQVANQHYKSFKIFWLNGRIQNNLRETLGVSDMLPGGAVYSPNRGIFITHRGAFSLESISEFFADVLSGNIRRSSRLDHLPLLEVAKDEL